MSNQRQRDREERELLLHEGEFSKRRAAKYPVTSIKFSKNSRGWRNVTSSLGVLRLLAIRDNKFQVSLKNARPISECVRCSATFSLAWKLSLLFERASSIIKNKYRRGSQSTEGGWLASATILRRERGFRARGLGIQVEKLRSFRKLIFPQWRRDEKQKLHSALFVRESPRVFFF